MHPYFSFFGRSVPAYGVWAAAGIILSLCVSLLRAARRRLSWENTVIIFTFALVFGFAGAFFTYLIVTYGFGALIRMIADGTLFTEITPGFVFYGGLIFGVPGALLASRIARVRLDPYACALMPALPLAHALGRVGCFFAGCCYGCATNLPIGVKYPASNLITDAPIGVPLLPVPLIEAAWLLILFVLLCLYTRKRRKGEDAASLYIALYAPVRLALEFFRGDEIRGFALGLSTSQIVSAWLLALLLARRLYLYAKNR